MLVLFFLRFLFSNEMVYKLKAWQGTWAYLKSQSAYAQYTNVSYKHHNTEIDMPLPDSYTIKVGAIPAYIEAMLAAEAPDRFSIKFLETLEFSSTNDRLWIGILKELGFLNTDGVPTERYYHFLDRSQAPHVFAEGIKEAYTDLFAVNKEAHKLDANEVFNKLRTLYKGDKKDTVIKHIAKTFVGLCDAADFPNPRKLLVARKRKSMKRTGRLS